MIFKTIKYFFLITIVIMCSCKKKKGPIEVGVIDNNSFFYHKFDPSIIVSNEFSLDINDDSKVDLTFENILNGGNLYTEYVAIARPREGTEIFESGDLVEDFFMNDAIYCNGNYSDAYALLYASYSSDFGAYTVKGRFRNGDQKYMAFKINDNGKWCLGWIRLSYSNGKTTVYEYGYKQNMNCK